MEPFRLVASPTHSIGGTDPIRAFITQDKGVLLTLMPTTSSLPSAAFAQRAAQICVENKANDVVLLDLRGVSDMTDFFVIASGTSDTHVRALGEHVLDDMKREGARAHHVEGLSQGRWVLLDYVDFVV